MHFPLQLQLLLISGKGGVGKTTTAAALAQHLAQAPRRVWLVSVDPAHSIGDVLEVKLKADPVPVAEYLVALALDAEAELVQFRSQYQTAVAAIADHSSLFEQGDLMGLWNLAWPGFDEVMAVIRVSQLLLTGVCDTVVLDMAPTGHATRLLEYPDFIERLLGVFEALHEKHQAMSRSFGGGYRAGEADQFLTTFTGLLRGLKTLLVDSTRTQAWVVLLPEELSLPETQRFLRFLGSASIPVGGIVVNQVLTVNPHCPQCVAWGQRQQQRLRPLRDLPIPLWQIPRFTEEPIGLVRLAEVFAHCTPLKTTPAIEETLTLPQPDPVGSGLPDYLALGHRLLLMAGKGGVGKTTMAAALALSLARRHPDRRILVVSIDPAHSLGDSFAQPLGPLPQPLTANLWGQEVEPTATLGEVLASLRAVLAGLNRDNMSIAELQTWQYLLDQPPPGLDEMAALLTVVNRDWDLIVLDTAPTGHLLRFLHLPQAMEAWLTYLLRLWVKYRYLFADNRLAEQFRTWRKQILQLQKDLIDPAHTVVLPILTPETTVVLETQRLLTELTRLGLKPDHLIVNRVLQPTDCPQCLPIAQRHAQVLAGLSGQLLPIPFLPTLPVGIEGLAIYGRYTYSYKAPQGVTELQSLALSSFQDMAP